MIQGAVRLDRNPDDGTILIANDFGIDLKLEI